MDNLGSVVRTDRSSGDPSARTQGRFSGGGRIQKLMAPARELIHEINRLNRLIRFLSRANQHRGWENIRKLKPRFLEYWREVCEFFKKEILAKYKFFVKVQASFTPLQLVKKLDIPKVESSLRIEKEDAGPPKGFVPLPDVEIGGCARNDSLIAPAI